MCVRVGVDGWENVEEKEKERSERSCAFLCKENIECVHFYLCIDLYVCVRQIMIEKRFVY